jgi:4-amino-4-deoxy-L-arabinose transferase-like glycosyltransferase
MQPDSIRPPSLGDLARSRRSDGTASAADISELGAVISAPAVRLLGEARPQRSPRDGEGLQRPTENRTRRRRSLAIPLPLLAVLAVQAALSLRLVWSNTAFQDEALYLRAGHLEWARWLHGTVIPNFPSYFSGAPVIYPPIAAVADSIGGLAAARALSLCFMIAVTSLLWATTARLYGQRAALLATGLFATLAGTQFLGALATYDAMALFLLAVAVWLAVRSVSCQPRAGTVLLVLSGCALAGADAVKYATALFGPVVVVVAAAATWRQHGGRNAIAAALTVLCSWMALTVASLATAGRQYWQGITTSTIDRPASNVSAAVIVQHSYVWTSLVLILAALGSVLSFRSRERARFLPAVLLVAALLAPAVQVRLHTTVSLQKHVVFGAWFAAIAAGYAMARLSRVDRGRGWAPVMAIPIVASTLFGSLGQASALFRVWPNSTDVIKVLRSAVTSHPGNYLAEDYDVEAYYLRAQVPWPRWSSTYYFRLPDAEPGAPSYSEAINEHYFALVILNFGDTAVTDREITADMRRAGGYHVLAHAGEFTIWASQQAAQAHRVRSTGASH